MLISFAVTNFRSIRERVELNLLKTGLKGLSSNYSKASNKKQLLNAAVIYGPNASGKSNFIRAMQALEFLIRKSGGFKPDDTTRAYEPHRLERNCLDKPVIFEISFISNKVQYDYLLSYTLERVEQEELYYYPGHTRTLLYSRFAEREMKFGDYYKGAKKTLEKLLLPNQLFLSKAAENNVEAILDAYRFFNKGFEVFSIMEEFDENSLASFYAKRLAEERDSVFSRQFNSLICALDTGISSVSVEEVDWKKFKFPGNMPDEVKKKVKEDFKYDIKTQHQLYEDGKSVGYTKFDVLDESAGTRSLFAIGGVILDALGKGGVLVVDEFEKNLHPSITQFLIQLFHSDLYNPRHAQLIFATHDITQLANDRFRRDQVWFTEKDQYGATSFLRCSDIPGIRLGTPLDKWYATGRFGATPIINDIEFITEMQANGETGD